MPLPTLTHLQFLVLGTLMADDRPGRYIRERLADDRVRMSTPAFYQAMSRLEDARLLKGWYEQKVVDGQGVRQRWYKVRGAVRRAWYAARDFYAQQAKAALQGQGSVARV